VIEKWMGSLMMRWERMSKFVQITYQSSVEGKKIIHSKQKCSVYVA